MPTGLANSPGWGDIDQSANGQYAGGPSAVNPYIGSQVQQRQTSRNDKMPGWDPELIASLRSEPATRAQRIMAWLRAFPSLR